MKTPFSILAILCAICGQAFAADPPVDTKPKAPVKIAAPQRPPTHANVAYGTHERQVLDFWKADSDKPTPLLFHIHGGGWVAGDKRVVANLEHYLAAAELRALYSNGKPQPDPWRR